MHRSLGRWDDATTTLGLWVALASLSRGIWNELPWVMHFPTNIDGIPDQVWSGILIAAGAFHLVTILCGPRRWRMTGALASFFARITLFAVTAWATRFAGSGLLDIGLYGCMSFAIFSRLLVASRSDD